MKKSVLTCAFAGLALGVAFAMPANAADVTACLITKTDTNPFFVKMKEGATAKAKELGVTLKSYAGKIDGDSESQVAAIESCIADGAKGILITASDTNLSGVLHIIDLNTQTQVATVTGVGIDPYGLVIVDAIDGD